MRRRLIIFVTLGVLAAAATFAAASGASFTTASSTAVRAATAPLSGDSLRANAGDGQVAAAGAAVATAPSVRVTDAGGNPVSGVAVTFAVASGGGSVTGRSATTDGSGIAAAGSWTLGATPGLNTLTATATGLGGSVTFTATGTAGVAAVIAVETAADGSGSAITTRSVTAGSSFTGYAVTRDAYGNYVANAAADWSLSGSTGGVASTDLVAAGDGKSAVFTGHLAGTAVVQAVSDGLSDTTGTVTVVKGSASRILASAGDGQSATVSTSVAIAPAALVTDAGGNPVPGVNVTFAVASGGGSATGLTATTDGNGIAAAGSWRLGTTAGTNTLTATSGALNGSPVTFTATAKAGPATKLIVSTGDLTPAAGSSVLVGAQLADQYGNPVKAADVPVTWSRTGANGSASTTDSDGLASYAFTAGQTAGTLCSVSATGTGLTSGSVDLTVVAAAASSMTLVSGTDGQTATVGTAVANDPAVKVTDPYGNPVSGASVTFLVASGGGSVDGAGQVTRTTGADGVATVTAWTLGTTAGADNNTLTAASGDLTSRTFTATGRAGAATQLIATTPVTSPSALAKSTLFTVTAQLADQYGNSVSTAGVTVNWSKSSSSYSFVPSTPTNSKTDETGKATITLRSASSSSRSCTVTGASTGLVSDSVLVTT